MNKDVDTRTFNRKYNYKKSDLGVVYNTWGTRFKLWSPKAVRVSLALYREGTGDNLIREIEMQPGEKGTWQLEVLEDLKGIYYTYKVERGQQIYEVMDPYAKACGVNGQRGMVVCLKETNPEGWTSQLRPKVDDLTEAVIYEMHIRDFSIAPSGHMQARGKFLALTEKSTSNNEGEATGVQHLKELGITHVQLLPCYDYLTVDEAKSDETQYNWGYDPLNYNIPEGSYATDPYHGEVRIKEFKQAIMALHNEGIGIIMDVVYNHTAQGEFSALNYLLPNYYYRTTKQGKFYNGSACGNEIASQRFMVRKMIIDSLSYWVTEYKIDGFRFDLMGVLDIETMNEIQKVLRKINPHIILYGEGWSAGRCGLPENQRAVKANAPRLKHIGVFNDDLRDAVRGDVFIPEAKGFISGAPHLEESVRFGIVAATKHPQIRYEEVNYSKAPYAYYPNQCINYVSVHDNYTLWDKIEKSCLGASLEEKIRMQKLANAIILTAQGVPLIHAGAEFARTKYGDENSYQSGDAINQLDWDRKSVFKEVYAYYKGLISLRKAHPAFRLHTREEIARHLVFCNRKHPHLITYLLKAHAGGDCWKQIWVAFNGSLNDMAVHLPKGNWEVVVNSQQAGIESLGKVTGTSVNVERQSALILAER